MRIAIDGMGGDLAPAAPVEAVLAAAREREDATFILVGDEARLRAAAGGAWPGSVRIVHTDSVIDMEEEPARAVRRKPDASLVVAARMVREGEADAMVSAGSTGALVAAGLLVIGRLPGIHRPALAPVLPTFSGRGVMLADAGATMDADSNNLLQFAGMASLYAQHVLGIDRPRIGLLNVGTEPGKGNQLCKEAFVRLMSSGLNFAGNIEARDLLSGAVDVAVCDGFVGNVVLKLVEGVGLGLFGAIREVLTAGPLQKLAGAVVKPGLVRLRDRFDYAEYGGAPFLGVAGGCIKAHGSSDARAWRSALRQAIRFVEQGMVDKMQNSLAHGAGPGRGEKDE
ncbi:phosphate acyltransferase PlsX [Alicyclobacillus sp.]|uniref:phosphate acyltransferase PlsX n=1 Tax=Alicyclobacillus sp. TaxID=61169 RepID=UPI0025C6F114|nr:phosphate acyltransferase PlsX [Alicyclobacillus sp.]MCL6516443.1 phosphate acyltransferase PlsX [Alicyclobacillus sp.]